MSKRSKNYLTERCYIGFCQNPNTCVYVQLNEEEVIETLLSRFRGNVLDKNSLIAIISYYKMPVECTCVHSKKIIFTFGAIRKQIVASNLLKERECLDILLNRYGGKIIDKKLLISLIRLYEKYNPLNGLIISESIKNNRTGGFLKPTIIKASTKTFESFISLKDVYKVNSLINIAKYQDKLSPSGVLSSPCTINVKEKRSY